MRFGWTSRQRPPGLPRGRRAWSLLLVLLSAIAFCNIYTYFIEGRAVEVPAVVNPTANFTAPADRNPREAGSNNDEDRSNKGPHGRDSDNSGAYDAHADQRQLPLPLGRDEPLKIIPAGTILEALVRFPCSLTEEDRYNRDTQSSKLRGGAGQAWPSSGLCVISCGADVRQGGNENSRGYADSEQREQLRLEKSRQGDELVAHDVTDDDRRECERGIRACELYQECTHVEIVASLQRDAGEGEKSAAGGGGRSSALDRHAILRHMSRQDASLATVQAAADAVVGGRGWGAGWGGKREFTLDNRARTYYVVSFGGSGSKMLGGWLSERGQSMVKEVFHIHDPTPTRTLFAMTARRAVSAGRTGKGMDFRGYGFPEGSFPSEGNKVQDVDGYRIVLIFKDPAEALVSRYFYNHCKNLRGADCAGSEREFPSLERYADEKDDRLHMEAFYDNYCGSTDQENNLPTRLTKNYPVVCINYHKIWDNKLAVVRALGLPDSEAEKLPTRTETVRNDRTSAARGEPFTLAMRGKLRKKHASLSKKVFEAPAVAIV